MARNPHGMQREATGADDSSGDEPNAAGPTRDDGSERAAEVAGEPVEDGTADMTAAEAMGQVPYGKGFSTGSSSSQGGGTSG